MAIITIRNERYGVVVKELDTKQFGDRLKMLDKIVEAIKEADWYGKKGE